MTVREERAGGEAERGEKDRFVQIAVGGRASGRSKPGLVAPPKINPVVLPSRAGIEVGDPGAPARLDETNFASRLAEVRAEREVWLRELAPPPLLSRPRQGLTQFEFRREDGKSGWEQVKIPHFAGPSGKWRATYRTRFRVSTDVLKSETVWLRFCAVDYKCQVMLNGVALGGHEGFFAPFEFDVTRHLVRGAGGGENELVVLVETDRIMMGDCWPGVSPTEVDGDKIYAATGLGWDEPGKGWHHCPSGLGIWQGVYLEGRPAQHATDVYVRWLAEGPSTRTRLELRAGVYSGREAYAPLRARVSIYPRNFEGAAVIVGSALQVAPAGPGLSEYRVTLEVPYLRLWSPETPHLYVLRLEIMDEIGGGGAVVDSMDGSFGVREFRMIEEGEGRGTLLLNGQPVILRGANTMGHEQRAIFDGKPEQVVTDLSIARLAHLNYLRITQRPVQKDFYDLCDRFGMMVQADLPMFSFVRRHMGEEMLRQAGELERLVRGHASVVITSYINEPLPLEWKKSGGGREHRWMDRGEMENLLRACSYVTKHYNPDRVIKPCDGDYEPPGPFGMPDEHCYCGWYGSHMLPIGQLHGNYLMPMIPGWRGGCGEYGSEGLDHWETMSAYYPKEWYGGGGADGHGAWTPERIVRNQTWDWGPQWFDDAATMAEWVETSQRHQAWATRTMTDAFRRRADVLVSTAVHLLIDAYPAGWLKSLVSVDRRPKKAYFEYADTLTPLAVNLRTDRAAVFGGEETGVEVWVLNDRPGDAGELAVVYEVAVEGKAVVRRRISVGARPCGAVCVGTIRYETPKTEKRTPMTVTATLVNGAGRPLHRHSVEMEVFPRGRAVLADRVVRVVRGPSASAGAAERMVRALGGRVVTEGESADLMIVESPEALEANYEMVLAALHGGAKVLFAEQTDPVSWHLGHERVTALKDCDCHFVSVKTGHPAVEGLRPRDLSWWYDPAAGHVNPTARLALKCDSLRAIALMSASGWARSRTLLPATGEMRVGKGLAVFNQVAAMHRVEQEPRAREYMVGLLEYMLRM
jgi:hypothetical protein